MNAVDCGCSCHASSQSDPGNGVALTKQKTMRRAEFRSISCNVHLLSPHTGETRPNFSRNARMAVLLLNHDLNNHTQVVLLE